MKFLRGPLYWWALVPFLFYGNALCVQGSEWTWLYKKRIVSQDIERYRKWGHALVSRYSTPAFTQLVFSWNATRPRGHFSFLVQARNKKTKRWYPWHRMLDWGAGIQRSYNSTTHFETNYHHVRLEIPKGAYADAFRIKVETRNGADLGHLKNIYVSVSNFSQFLSERPVPPRTSVLVKGVPRQSQMILEHPEATRLCSPTSTSMLVGTFLDKSIDPAQFAQSAYDCGLDAYGSWPFNTAHAYEQCNGKANVYVSRLSSFDVLYRHLRRNVPVVVSVRGELKGAAKEYNNGHLLVVVGWDAQKKRVLCHDPAFDSDAATVIDYDLASFLKAWERSRRLAYVAEPISRA